MTLSTTVLPTSVFTISARSVASSAGGHDERLGALRHDPVAHEAVDECRQVPARRLDERLLQHGGDPRARLPGDRREVRADERRPSAPPVAGPRGFAIVQARQRGDQIAHRGLAGRGADRVDERRHHGRVMHAHAARARRRRARAGVVDASASRQARRGLQRDERVHGDVRDRRIALAVSGTIGGAASRQFMRTSAAIAASCTGALGVGEAFSTNSDALKPVSCAVLSTSARSASALTAGSATRRAPAWGATARRPTA